jgi:hypothetical protein
MRAAGSDLRMSYIRVLPVGAAAHVPLPRFLCQSLRRTGSQRRVTGNLNFDEVGTGRVHPGCHGNRTGAPDSVMNQRAGRSANVGCERPLGIADQKSPTAGWPAAIASSSASSARAQRIGNCCGSDPLESAGHDAGPLEEIQPHIRQIESALRQPVAPSR